jgi:hypothetical protein
MATQQLLSYPQQQQQQQQMVPWGAVGVCCRQWGGQLMAGCMS